MVSSIVILTQKFTPECPRCHVAMLKIKGQKDGAWRCRECLGEYWDKIEAVAPDISNPMEGLIELHSDFTPECNRCKLPMKLFREGAWYCEQCEGQFWDRPSPEFGKLHDQMIRSTTKDIMHPDGGFKMLMSAKKRSRGGSKSKRRGSTRVASSFEARYGSIIRDNDNSGRKGA
jgi:ribosomal protein L37AE/L43A